MSQIEVLSVASEAYPLVKTGGLADVVGALPAALAGEGITVRTLLPGYRQVLDAMETPRVAGTFSDLPGGPARLIETEAAGLALFVLDAPALFDRPGGPYAAEDGQDHPDNAGRFAAFARIGAEIARGAVEGYQPDLLHAHDWQAALAPVYLKASGDAVARSVLTIHNLAFQGNFPADLFDELGLPPDFWSIDGVEFYGQTGFLKGGIWAADLVTTVSPTYAREIARPESGMGLHGLLGKRGSGLVGIINGLDTRAWDPETDPAIPKPFSRSRLKGREAARHALEAEFGFKAEKGPIFAVVSRLTWQKGHDLVADLADEIVARGARLVVIGTGERLIEGRFLAAQTRHPGRIGVRIGFDEGLSHRIQAGADVLLVPSRFEPCGLTQLSALRYGCVPLVSVVGGLADTIVDANYAAVQAGCATGVAIRSVTLEALLEGVDRTIALHTEPAVWRALQRAGMKTDVSWNASAKRYAGLFRRLLEETTA